MVYLVMNILLKPKLEIESHVVSKSYFLVPVMIRVFLFPLLTFSTQFVIIKIHDISPRIFSSSCFLPLKFLSLSPRKRFCLQTFCISLNFSKKKNPKKSSHARKIFYLSMIRRYDKERSFIQA